MTYVIYPICTFCQFPFKLIKLFIDPCSILKFQYLCKCPHVKKHTRDFDEYYSKLLLNNNLHNTYDYDDCLSCGYCETCHYDVCLYCYENHEDHILLKKKIKKIIPKCQLHRDNLSNYCETCSKGLCNKYTNIHQGHEIISVKDLYQKVKEKIDIFKSNNIYEYIDKLLGQRVNYKNENFISSMKSLFALFIDCFNSKIGLLDVNIMTNVNFLLSIKKIEFYPYIIHKPYLIKIPKTYGCFPLLSLTNPPEDFDDREMRTLLFMKQLINKKFIIQYRLPSGYYLQILDNQLSTVEKEFEFSNTIKFFEELQEEIALIGYYSKNYENGLDIIDFTGVPKQIKSYTESLILKTNKHFCETFDYLTIFDENTFFYPLPKEYMYIDIKNNKIIALAEYGIGPEITLVKKASDGTLAVLFTKNQKIEFWDFYKKKHTRSVIIPLEGVDNHSDCIIYPKKYIITWIRKTYSEYIVCWDDSTLNLMYCVPFKYYMFSLRPLSKNDIIIENHLAGLTFCKIHIETGQISQIIRIDYVANLDFITAYLDKSILILDDIKGKIFLLT